MTGRFDIVGDLQKVLQYSRTAVRLTETAAGIDAEFAGEGVVDPLRGVTRGGRGSPVGTCG